MNKKLVAVIAFAVVASAVLIALVYESRDSDAASTRIAMNLAMTGPVAAASGEYPLAFQMGLDDACERLSFERDRFRVDVADNRGTARDAATGFQQQLTTGFDAYISGLSYASVTIAPELDEMDIPHFVIAFDSFITANGPNRFRLLPSYKLQGPMFVEYARAVGARRVFMLTLNNAYIEEEFARFVEPGLQAAGIEFQRETFELSATDYRTLALKATSYSPDLIMIDTLSFQMLPLVQSIRTLGFNMDRSLVCSMDFIFLLYGADIPEDVYGVTFIAPPFEIPGAVEGADEWRERFRDYGGREPNFIQAYAYDTAQVMVESKRRFGDVRPSSIEQVFPFEGITGVMRLDEDRDLITPLGFMMISPEGARVSVELDGP